MERPNNYPFYVQFNGVKFTEGVRFDMENKTLYYGDRKLDCSTLYENDIRSIGDDIAKRKEENIDLYGGYDVSDNFIAYVKIDGDYIQFCYCVKAQDYGEPYWRTAVGVINKIFNMGKDNDYVSPPMYSGKVCW